MEHIDLSILICHLNSREASLGRLLAKLHAQKVGFRVEVLVNSDDGEKTVGKKRNELLLDAKGDYVAYVDDDDDVSNDYVQSIIEAVKGRPDCVGIEGILESNVGNALFRHSIQFQGWYTAEDAFYRTPNHLNPVKRSIAQRIGFPNQSVGEDQRYSDALRRALKTEVYIGHPIYIYKKEYALKCASSQ